MCFCTFQECMVHVARAAGHFRILDCTFPQVARYDAGTPNFVRRWSIWGTMRFLRWRRCEIYGTPARKVKYFRGPFSGMYSKTVRVTDTKIGMSIGHKTDFIPIRPLRALFHQRVRQRVYQTECVQNGRPYMTYHFGPPPTANSWRTSCPKS